MLFLQALPATTGCNDIKPLCPAVIELFNFQKIIRLPQTVKLL